MSKKIKKTGNEENILLLDGIFKAHMHPEIRKKSCMLSDAGICRKKNANRANCWQIG